jgi:hypothetical protein
MHAERADTPATSRTRVKTGLEVLVNFVLPFAIFVSSKDVLGDANALMASSIPPICWSIAEFVRARRIDALSVLVLTGIVLSLIAFLGGGDIRLLQLRENLVAGLIGLVFLGSAAIGRPLIYYLARATIRRTSHARAARLAAISDNPIVKRAMLVMTLAWGIGLVIECTLASVLVFVLTIAQYLLVAPIVGYGLLGAMMVWTFWYARRSLGSSLRSDANALVEGKP